MLDKIEGRFLVTFLSVLEEGSFSRSSEKLGYVQSTVTAHIQQLEAACGQTLFHRMPRGVKPTEAGLAMAEYARQFRQLGTLLEERMIGFDEPRGDVRIRTMESFCVTRLGRFLPSFLAQYPDITLHLDTGFQNDIVEATLRHVIDFGIVPRDPGRADLTFEPLIAEPMAFVASKALADRVNRHGWESLNEENVIGFGKRCLYQTAAASLLEGKGLRKLSQVEFPSTELIRQMISYGRGIAFLPKIAIMKELDAGLVAEIVIDDPLVLTHGLITYKDRALSTAATIFKNRLLASDLG